MNKLAYCLAALTIILPMPGVSGEEPPSASLQEKRECSEQMRERTAAITLRDWPALDKIARRFIQFCSGVHSRRDIANAYGDIADANNEMGRFEEALAQANAGIALHYLEPSNHLEKVKALFALNKIKEAKESFKVADHVIHLAIEQSNANLQNARFDFERESNLTDISLYQAQLESLARYRPQLENK